MKILILQACLVLAAGAAAAAHADVGDVIDVSKDDAYALTRMGRGMYLERGDDPTKGSLTATTDDVKRAKKMAEAIARDLVERERNAAAQSPQGIAELIAASVASAVQAALAAQAAQLVQASAPKVGA